MTGHIGIETIEYLDAEYPNSLKESERKALQALRQTGDKPNSIHQEIFVHHREHLRSNPKLYKKWQVVIFDKPVEETDDLVIGLIKLAEKAYQKANNDSTSVLLIWLRGSEKKSFWRQHKNWNLCRYLRDRYRGLPSLMEPDVVIDFGRCWEPSILDNIGDKNEKGSTSAVFEFEAHIVDRQEIHRAKSDRRTLGHQNRAQMTWRPGHTSFAAALSEDLHSLLPSGCSHAFMLRSKVSAARGAGGVATTRPTVYAVNSITDSFGESSGALANPEAVDAQQDWSRIDQFWLGRFESQAEGAVAIPDIESIRQLFVDFRRHYSIAIADMIRDDGVGLGSASLVTQAQCYGALLAKLRETARTDTLVRESWTPLLQVGMAIVEGDSPAVIVTPWHPLRLFELAAKARQATQAIRRIMKGSSPDFVSISDYVSDRVYALRQTYYVDVGLMNCDKRDRLLVETEAHAGYSVLQPPVLQSGDRLLEVPVTDAVTRFGEIAAQYLRQRPHERANFSTVLLDTEAEDLPIMVAKHLAREIDNEPQLRCDLTVAHADPHKLRQIYERQNRRIGHEIESSLTSEAARIFMSRLRVDIAPLTLLGSTSGVKRHDIVLLHDVVARFAEIKWDKVGKPQSYDDPRDHASNDTSRRKSQIRGNLSTSVYLTAPLQIESSQAYLDVLHDAISGTASPPAEHLVPLQRVDLSSREIAEKLNMAHNMAHWVITYDRIADRRIIASADGRLRILRYYSTPRSVHNVIVSTEIRNDELRSRLADDLQRILPDYDSGMLDDLVSAVRRQAINLAGCIVMRGSHWDNYAREFIGVIVAQRELELLLANERECRTAMFFLDEFKSWLDLKGEIADILAVSLHVRSTCSPIMQLVVAEAKCVNESSLSASRIKSREQLEATYTAIMNRFANDEKALEPSIWRNRLADMLIEHMVPWGEQDRLGEMNFDEWIEAIRNGKVGVEVSGHSIITVHDQPRSSNDLELWTGDPEKLPVARRRLAQWTLGADRIKNAICSVTSESARPQLHIPVAWPGTGPAAPPAPGGDPPTDAGEQTSSNGTDDSGKGIDPSGGAEATGPSTPPDPEPQPEPMVSPAPSDWQPSVFGTLMAMSRVEDERQAKQWLDDQVSHFRRALQAENMDARIEGARLTPNAGIVHIDGLSVTVRWLSNKQVDLLTRYRIDIVRIEPRAGYIAVAIRRPERAILHLSDAWKQRQSQESSPETNMALVVGEREDNGSPFYLSLNQDFAGYERAAPHTLISGTTGSGKGILTSNLILDICAFNSPRSVAIYLIDPKQGADYLWARDLPHLHDGIVDRKDTAIRLLRRLVQEMEARYSRITQDGCANIDQYNRKHSPPDRLPRVVIFFDEVANWMQDDEFKHEVESVINEIATKSRAAGLHLFMVYQRADNQVMTMQLRTNLGNKLILRLGDEGSSKIALGEKGAERLLGKGHIIAKLGNDEKIYGQVPFIGEDEIASVAGAIKEAWAEPKE